VTEIQRRVRKGQSEIERDKERQRGAGQDRD